MRIIWPPPMPRAVADHLVDWVVRPARASIAWAFDRDSCSPRLRRWLSAAVFATYIALVLVAALHHEFWRDEVTALSTALGPESVLGVPAALQDDGHPALWYLLLRVAHDLFGTKLVLPMVGTTIGIATAGLLFFCAPLPTWFRVAFLFGAMPLYEYTVMCRNYGIGMLLVFLFCHAVGRRRPRPIVAAAMLMLLANTNVYGAMIACGLGVFLLVDVVRDAATRRPLRVAIVLLLIGGGLFASAWTMWPTGASKISHGLANVADKVGVSWLDSLLGFGNVMRPLFGFLAPLAWGVVLLTAVSVLSLPHLAAAVVLVFVAAACFAHIVYPPAFRHLGMLLAMLVAVLWIRAGRVPVLPAGSAVERNARRLLLWGIWPLLLALHGYKGLRAVKDEVELTRTSAPELADFLTTHGLRDAVLLGEPDYYLDSLPFYADNEIFIAREGRYGRRVSWTLTNRPESDLGELLAAARAVQRERGGAVLIVIGLPVALERASGEARHGYGDHFAWSEAQRDEFLAATERIASFPKQPARFTGDEAYDLYRLR